MSEPEISKEQKRRIQLRDAQRRYYNAHKKKEREEVPPSYQADHIRNYHKSYYEKNKEKLNQKAKERYNVRKMVQQAMTQPIPDTPNPPQEPQPNIQLVLPSLPVIADFERITYNC